LAATEAVLLPDTSHLGFSDEKRVERGNDRSIAINSGKRLHAGSTPEGENGLVVRNQVRNPLYEVIHALPVQTGIRNHRRPVVVQVRKLEGRGQKHRFTISANSTFRHARITSYNQDR
jgi:hypothetical protein